MELQVAHGFWHGQVFVVQNEAQSAGREDDGSL